MLAVEIDRHAIERRDFPLARRGYDAAAVDAHLRDVADRVDELARSHAQAGAGAAPLAAAAGTQVQSIIATAESAAADIRRDAAADAARTREEAVAAARAHVDAVSAAAAALLEHVRAADTSFGELSASARAAAEQLVRDLATLEHGIGELYDAAGAQHDRSQIGRPAPQARERNEFPIPTEVPGSTRPVPSSPLAVAPGQPPAAGAGVHAPAPSSSVPAPRAQTAPRGEPANGADGGADRDADSARLVALNMALGGSSREDTRRYLDEHFALADPLKLVDEVYAAVEA